MTGLRMVRKLLLSEPRSLRIVINRTPFLDIKTSSSVASPVQQSLPFSCPTIYQDRRAANQWKETISRTTTRGVKYWPHPTFKDDVPLEQKEQWLSSLLAQTPEKADTNAYLQVLRALAHCKDPDAPLRAEHWLQRLEKASESSPSCVPTAECYQCVIQAWAAAEHEEDPVRAITRAERWLRKHLGSSMESLRPDTACFNAFLDACSKGRGLKNNKNKNLGILNAQKAQSTLDYMIKERQLKGDDARISPDTDSFNFVIRAWTRCRRSPDVAERAMGVLRMLEKYQRNINGSVGPDSKSYAMVLDAISVKAKLKAKRCEHKKSARSDPNENGLNEIMLLKNTLSFMQKRAGQDSNLAPVTHSYNMLISAWANVSSIHTDAPFEAEKVLQQMISLKDDGEDKAAPDGKFLFFLNTCCLDRED